MVNFYNGVNKHSEQIQTTAEAIINELNTNAPKELDNMIHLNNNKKYHPTNL